MISNIILSLICLGLSYGAELPFVKVGAPVKTISASVTTTSVLLAAAREDRVSFVMWNNSGNSAYITFGPVSVSSSPTFILGANTHFIWQTNGVAYTGPISAIRNAGTGTITIYEFTH